MPSFSSTSAFCVFCQQRLGTTSMGLGWRAEHGSDSLFWNITRQEQVAQAHVVTVYLDAMGMECMAHHVSQQCGAAKAETRSGFIRRC